MVPSRQEYFECHRTHTWQTSLEIPFSKIPIIKNRFHPTKHARIFFVQEFIELCITMFFAILFVISR